MSEPGATRRPHSRRKNQSKGLKPFVILGAILAVVAPIAWILGQETGGGLADESIPYVNRDDDRYTTPDHEIPIVDSTPGDVPSTAPTPTATPSTPGSTPTPTPGETTTPDRLNTETPVPTTAPTDRPTATNTVPATSRPTTTSRPTSKPTTTTTSSPTPTPTETTRTPTDDGGMTNYELELFSNLNAARQDNGCGPLKRSTGLTDGARADAEKRAASGEVNATGKSYAATGGEGVDTAKEAADRLLRDNSSTVLNCDLTTLGVGRWDATFCKLELLGACLNSGKRYSWVTSFR